MLAGKIGYFRATTHPEALAWQTRVIANGGTVSASTLAAVSNFCTSIDAAGLRDRFYRLNLFCGTGLSAAVVPLYRGQTPSATLGNATDTNNNFVSGDYVETGSTTGGLKGNGSNKWLMTGLNPVTIGAASTSLHLCAYVRLAEAAGTSRVMIGNANAGDAASLLGFVGGGSVERFVSGNFQLVNATSGGAGVSGMLHGNQLSTQLDYFRNGASVAGSSFQGAALSNVPFGVFASATSSTAAFLFSLARFFRAYSIGLGMTSQQASDYNTAMQAFQTALTRNV